jgi:hypothetical protein
MSSFESEMMIGACEVVPLPEGVRKRYPGMVVPARVMVIFGAEKSSVSYAWLGHMSGDATVRDCTNKHEVLANQWPASNNSSDRTFFILVERGFDGKHKRLCAIRGAEMLLHKEIGKT